MKTKLITLALVISSFMPIVTPIVRAQATVPPVNINDSGFHLVVCDGPPDDPHTTVPCDFQHLMIQAQYLINVMIVLGVLAAMIGFAYIGFLYVSGTQDSRSRAKSIFPKLFWGFIIMLVAWFAVFQILQWLTGNASAYLMTK